MTLSEHVKRSGSQEIMAGGLTPDLLGHPIDLTTEDGAIITDYLVGFEVRSHPNFRNSPTGLRVWLANVQPVGDWKLHEGAFHVERSAPVTVYPKPEAAA